MQHASNWVAVAIRLQIVLNAGKFDLPASPPFFVFLPILRLLAMKVESQMLQLPLQLHNNKNNNNNGELLCEEYYIEMRASRTNNQNRQTTTAKSACASCKTFTFV